MKLDVGQLKFLSKEEFRVLSAVELGQKNHELVPVPLIDSIAGLKHGGTVKRLKVLLKSKLVHYENTVCDGYRLTYLGYDYLAIKALLNRGMITGIGRQIGVGKEADVYEATNEEGEVLALKLHRLGRTSFRAVKAKRDYLKHRNSFSWLYLSRLAAVKEFAFMKALGEHGFPVPKAIDNNRHVVLMELKDAFPLVQVREVMNPGLVFRQCMEMMSRLTVKGLIHCDFNEFNLLIDEEENVTLIDFPQMVSIGHGNARELFYRDVDCVIRFFKKKLGYIPEHDVQLQFERPNFDKLLAEMDGDIGPELEASGFEREHQLTLEEWQAQQPSERCSDEIGVHGLQLEDPLAMPGAADRSSSADSTGSCETDERLGGSEASSDAAGRTPCPGENGFGCDEGGNEETSGDVMKEGDIELDSAENRVMHESPVSRLLPSQGAVQERLASEMRKAKQSSRLRSAAKSARKASSAYRTKKKGSGVAS